MKHISIEVFLWYVLMLWKAATKVGVEWSFKLILCCFVCKMWDKWWDKRTGRWGPCFVYNTFSVLLKTFFFSSFVIYLSIISCCNSCSIKFVCVNTYRLTQYNCKYCVTTSKLVQNMIPRAVNRLCDRVLWLWYFGFRKEKQDQGLSVVIDSRRQQPVPALLSSLSELQVRPQWKICNYPLSHAHKGFQAPAGSLLSSEL